MDEDTSALTHENTVFELRTGQIVDSHEAVKDKITLEAFVRGSNSICESYAETDRL